MTKDLTNSRVDRQNILNNSLAISEIQEASNIRGIIFEGKSFVTKSMVASFFDVELRTIERYVSENADELLRNGYEILRGQRLNEHDVVRLKDNREGAIVHIYPGKRAYCVEIVDDQGQTLDLVDVEEKDIAEVTWRSK